MGGLRTATDWRAWGVDGGGYEQGSRSCDRGGWEHRAGTIVGEETRREEREMGGENLTVSVRVLRGEKKKWYEFRAAERNGK